MAETRQTRITWLGGNPTTYNDNSARILKGKDVLVLRPEGGIEHRMYDDGTLTRVDNRTGEFIPVPEEYESYWRNAFEQAKSNAKPNLLQRGVHWVGRGVEKAGNWLQRFEDGGITQTAQSPEQDVMNTIDAAIGEIQTKRPGQAVQKLAAMMQDPNYSMIIDMIKQEYPQIEGVLNTVEQMVGAYKCGGKTKKKVKKGAKGCVPCKKLMKVGGKLINVLTDCEGNIISKHQAGGWLIPKGYNGLLTDKLVADKYRTVNTGTATEGAEHYYIADDGSLRKQYAVANNNNGFDWAYENLNQNLNHEGFNKWLSGTINSDTGERTGGVSDFWANGVNYNNGAVTFNDETTAKGILGEEAYNKGAITGNSVHGVSKSGNTWLGDKVEDLNVTAQDYVQHHGNWQNAMQAENDILKAKRKASRQLRREQIKNINRGGTYDPDGDGPRSALTGSAARQAIRSDRRKYMNNARSARVYNQAAILNTQTPKLNTVTPVSMSGTSSTTTSILENNTLAKKQGGWLTKFN